MPRVGGKLFVELEDSVLGHELGILAHSIVDSRFNIRLPRSSIDVPSDQHVSLEVVEAILLHK